jgi:DNA modification methylase
MEQSITKRHALYNGDCVEVMRGLPDGFVDFSVFSPPFANLYIYSDDLRDMGNNPDEAAFLDQLHFMTEQLYRIMRPGRLVAVHCKQLALAKYKTGKSGLHDFRGDIIRHFEEHGFTYHSEVCIWIDPVAQMQKTKSQKLLYCNLRRDASVTGVGMPEYLCVFRKFPKDDDETTPVRHYKPDEKRDHDAATDVQVMNLDTWQRYASPVWFDIRRSDVLNAKVAREDKDEKHICPLQLEVIRRAVQLWSNPGEVVFSPFGGIGSEPYVALEQGRRAMAVELKPSYYKTMVRNCEDIEHEPKQESIFDVLGLDAS